MDEVLGTVGVHGYERQVDFCLHDMGKLDFRLFCSLSDSLVGGLILGDVEAAQVLELVDEILLHDSVDILDRASDTSPPQAVSPLVALTSITFLPISRMEISKVPPPKS